MKRSEKAFPFDDFELTDFMKTAWECGWFDDFSDEHFLIMALENRLHQFNWEYQFISNTAIDVFTPLQQNGKIDFRQFSHIFHVNLSIKLAVMERRFGTDQIKNFIVNQLSAGKAHYNNDSFFQALSEVEILSFYCRQDWDAFTYEPHIGIHGANPEARFERTLISTDGATREIQVNIEVKTPKFPIPENPRQRVALPTILLSETGRQQIQTLCNQYDMKCLFPRVTKLVQFINSAASKFEVPKENQYNLLYINWSYSDFPSDGFLEPWVLLTNELNGILTHREIGINLPFDDPIHPDAYDKISAIIVYSSSIDQLMFSDFRYVWQTSPLTAQKFRMFVLNKELEENELSGKSSELFEITGMKPSIPEEGKWHTLLDFNWDKCGTAEQKNKDAHFQQTLHQIIAQNPLL